MRFLLCIFALLLLPFMVYAGELDYSDFARIPILHEGRIKPLDSFARISLKKIYGDKALPDRPAIAWLAGVMFDPATAMHEKIFVVHTQEVVSILGLPDRHDRLFDFSEMAAGIGGHEQLIKSLIAKDKKQLTANEQELIRLYMGVNDFGEIMGGFSLLLPFPDNPDFNYIEASRIKQQMDVALMKTVKEKGDKIDEYTPEEQKNARLSYRMSVLYALDHNNSLLRVIPPYWEGTEEWLAPWAVIGKGAGAPASVALFHDWQEVAKCYNEKDAEYWHVISEALRMKGEGVDGVRPFAINLEVMYNAFDPLKWCAIGYTLGTLVALVAMLLASEAASIAAFAIILASTGVHGLGILMRMTILLRPPVSTLYESMIFVSFMIACFGLWLERKKGSGESLLMGGMVAALLIMAANVFAADTDTLEVLVAVLNTNFWLGTHVVCITTGYASSLLAGALAHIYLLRRAIGKTEAATLATLQRRLHSVALVALLFTSVGTMLGGIWADQSWGRFWGWDPKENGALWIVLWLVWMLHSRIAGQVRELGFASGMAFINIIVALAWVGVNLLSVGLHSYGFTDVAANGLMIFCGAEVVFIATITAAALQRGVKQCI